MKNELKKELRKLIKINSTINLVLVSVSKNGMSRNFKVLASRYGKVQNITLEICRLLDYKCKFDGNANYLTIGGCGMDMAFKLSHDIKLALYTKNQFIKAGYSCGYDGSYCLV